MQFSANFSIFHSNSYCSISTSIFLLGDTDAQACANRVAAATACSNTFYTNRWGDCFCVPVGKQCDQQPTDGSFIYIIEQAFAFGLLDFARDWSCGPLAGFVLSVTTLACFDSAADCSCGALIDFVWLVGSDGRAADQMWCHVQSHSFPHVAGSAHSFANNANWTSADI